MAEILQIGPCIRVKNLVKIGHGYLYLHPREFKKIHHVNAFDLFLAHPVDDESFTHDLMKALNLVFLDL